MSKRRVFDIDFDSAPAPAPEPVPAGTEERGRRGPMAAAITENAGALRSRQAAEAAIRAENDRLAHEFVRLKQLGLVVDSLPVDAIRIGKLTRDRAANRDPELDELKESIRAIGLSNPIRVEEDGEGGFELIQGFRRLSAYRELFAETGDEHFAFIPAGLVARGQTLEALYRRMVDENLVRRDISFAEMAQLARSYLADPQTEARDIDAAIATLYSSAGRQKRIYIRNFATLLDRIGAHVAHPHAIPRALGLSLLKRLEREPGATSALSRALMAETGRDEAAELALLRQFAEAAGQGATGGERVPAGTRPAPTGAARTAMRVAYMDEVARLTAGDGRVEIRMERDFSAVDRHTLEKAVEAFLLALEE
ncbi:ParB/RepB/Spo0J family partition protein [Frigidibacter sp. MR17.24]|uniref:ParB/RepB/Spo0J family partition protein n=1 Tax=Frigidibacter sp. MR17.24 TaxID=3127345 RepID=UPI0030129FC3